MMQGKKLRRMKIRIRDIRRGNSQERKKGRLGPV
jgi:hypothetical protein